MTVVAMVAGSLLTAAALLTIYRVLAGPNTLDRMVGIDTLIAVAICGLAVWAVYSGDTTVVPGIVALSLVGFLGSASVARFRVPDEPETTRNGGGPTDDARPRHRRRRADHHRLGARPHRRDRHRPLPATPSRACTQRPSRRRSPWS